MEDVLSDWEHLLSSSAPSLPPPATTLTTSYTFHDSFLTVFPPVNHEGLPVAPPLANSHHHDSPSTATSAAMTNTSSASPPIPLPTDFHTGDSTIHKHSLYSRSPSPISPLARWIGLALQLLNSKVISAFSNVRSRVSLVSYPSESPISIGLMAGASLTGLGLWIWWRRRRWRPRGSTDDTIEHLNLLIREKDEKIIELLLQVAQLNKLLLARYRVPVVKEC